MGKWVITAFAAFAAFILYLAISSINQNIDLVSEDYYAQELKHEARMMEVSNALPYNEGISVKAENKKIVVTFPEELGKKHISGNINFFRPSDNVHDRNVTFHLESTGAVAVNREILEPGYYKVHITWAMDGKDYYITKTLNV